MCVQVPANSLISGNQARLVGLESSVLKSSLLKVLTKQWFEMEASHFYWKSWNRHWFSLQVEMCKEINFVFLRKNFLVRSTLSDDCVLQAWGCV